MYYTEIDPRTMKPVYVAKTPHDKAMQRALLQWARPDKRKLVIQALHEAGRTDLIGFGRECLVRPERSQNRGKGPVSGKKTQKTEEKRGQSRRTTQKSNRKGGRRR
jgi:hypothetical protein